MKEIIKDSLKEFAEKDWQDLIKIDAHEITLAHRIAVYLEDKFKGYNIDLEYNRDKNEIKRDSKEDIIRPDIIIHRRNTDDNLCIFEIKKCSVNDEKAKKDIKKLKDAIKKYGYKLGVFIGIQKTRSKSAGLMNPIQFAIPIINSIFSSVTSLEKLLFLKSPFKSFQNF